MLEKIFPHRPKIILRPNVNFWHLCRTSETRLQTAMLEGGVILVDDIFLAKVRGRLAALAISNGMSVDGTPIDAGTWYCPSGSTRSDIQNASDRGITKLHLASSAWIKIRPSHEAIEMVRSSDNSLCIGTIHETRNYLTPEELLNKVNEVTKRLQRRQHRVLDGRSRRDYRSEEEEDQY